MARWWIGIAVAAATGTAFAAGPSPSQRGRAVVARQLAALDDPAAFVATLAPDALILGNGSFSLASGTNAPEIVRTLSATRSRLPVIHTDVKRLDAGGNADVVWFTADVEIVRGERAEPGALLPRKSGRAGRDVTTARLTELVAADAGTWSVVALAFQSTPGASAPTDALAAPGTGRLTAAIASLRDLDRALSDEATTTVVGICGELGIGPAAAHRVLAPWRERETKLTSAIEIRTKTWGLAAGELAIAGASSRAAPIDVKLLVFAIPDRRDWNVVVVSAVRRVPSQPDTFIDPSAPPCP